MILDQMPCNSCGEKLSAFFVLRSTGAAITSPCRSRMALKKGNFRERIPDVLFRLHKKATAQVLLNAHANPEVVKDPVSDGLRSLLAFT